MKPELNEHYYQKKNSVALRQSSDARGSKIVRLFQVIWKELTRPMDWFDQYEEEIEREKYDR